MKKLSLVLLCAIVSTASIAQKSYTIKGTIPVENNGKQVYLYDYNAEKRIDSTIVADGAFVLKNKIAEPSICRIAIAGTRTSGDMIVENCDIAVSFNDEGTFNIKADGLNAPYAKILEYQGSLETRAAHLLDSLKAVHGDNRDAMAEAYYAVITPLIDNLQQLYDGDMKSNTDNVYGVLCVWKLADFRVENMAQLDSLMAIVPGAAIFAPLKAQRKQFQTVEATGPGQMFKDFPAQTIDGKPTNLSDYVGKGKYVLVDFWASWCGPCMREVPNLKYLHETYPDLMVLGVNVWDKHDKYLEAIEKKGMTWTSIYASHDNTATATYGIQGIPTIILFAPDGKIIDRTLRGEEMKAFIADLFKK